MSSTSVAVIGDHQVSSTQAEAGLAAAPRPVSQPTMSDAAGAPPAPRGIANPPANPLRPEDRQASDGAGVDPRAVASSLSRLESYFNGCHIHAREARRHPLPSPASMACAGGTLAEAVAAIVGAA